MTEFAIRVRNAYQNNLKGISVDIAFGELVCITGVSGSGKSTLIEHCIGKLAHYRHQALSGKMLPNFYEEGADTSEVPFVSYIQQGTLFVSNRSVVGTALGIVQKLRQLVIPHSCVRDGQGNALQPMNSHELVQWCLNHHPNAKLSLAVCLERMVLGPAARYIRPAMQRFPDARIKVMDAQTHYEHADLQFAEKYAKSVFRSHKDIYAVISNLKADDCSRLTEAFDQAMAGYPYQDLILVLENKDQLEMIPLREALLSQFESQVYYKPSEALLSFNSKASISGRCPMCNGTGRQVSIAEEALFDRNDLPVAAGGLALNFNSKTGEYLYFPALCNEIRGVLVAQDESLNATWAKLKVKTREILALGSTEAFQPLASSGKPKGKKKAFVGILLRIKLKLDGSSSAAQGLGHLLRDNECNVCVGTRLNYAARAVHFAGQSFSELIGMTLEATQIWLHGLLKQKDYKDAKPMIGALEAICVSCIDLGLGHLQLSRATDTLSGGEAQRLRIARDMWARLDNACYVLDEPTRGLHSADILSLIHVFKKLCSPQNCVLLVEHNPFLVSQSDRVIELGLHGGAGGGEVIYDGTAQLCPMLHASAATPAVVTPKEPLGWIIVKDANLRTVVNQSFKLPLGQMTCFTGVSGSGKTTLVAGVLLPALDQLQSGLDHVCSHAGKVFCEGMASFRLVFLSQSMIGGNYRSRVLTYIGLADTFREWFCKQSVAETSGLTASHFSPNTPEGQCLTCEGQGRIASGTGIHNVCPSCCGSGFNPESTFVRAHDMSITQWMDSSLLDLASCAQLPKELHQAAELASELGLGHLCLGRPIPTLSGGECQRLRIIKALLDVESKKNDLYQKHLVVVMDEPSAGLHPKDVNQLHVALKKNITSRGHTLLLIEHNLHLIGSADWIVDMGPGSAAGGGQILFAGSMADFCKTKLRNSPTYIALKRKLHPESVIMSHQSVAPNELLGESAQADVLAAVNRFAHYLKGESESLDETELSSQPVMPTYEVETDELSRQSFAHAVGLEVPLFRFFAAESKSRHQSIFNKQEDLESQALELLHKGYRIGWFPSPSRREVAAWPDTAEIIKAHIKIRQGEWFDGNRVSDKLPAVNQPKVLGKVRLLLPKQLEPQEAVHRALSLGKGWVSLVSSESGEVQDLSMRFIDLEHLRLGARWQVPHIFDASFSEHNCLLCGGNGSIESVDQRLIFMDESKALKSDQLFQPHALEVLRLARRQVLLPATKRLRESALIDLSVPLNTMTPAVSVAFWFGYPYKAFLKSGGKKSVLGDWHRWQGINKTVLLNMWKCSSRDWSEQINASRAKTRCPECDGSGLGWEAKQRVVAGVSLQDIYCTYTFRQLHELLHKHSMCSDVGTKVQNKIVNLINTFPVLDNCDFRIFEQLKHLTEEVRQAALSVYISNHALNNANIYLKEMPDKSSQTLKKMLAKTDALHLMSLLPKN